MDGPLVVPLSALVGPAHSAHRRHYYGHRIRIWQGGRAVLAAVARGMGQRAGLGGSATAGEPGSATHGGADPGDPIGRHNEAGATAGIRQAPESRDPPPTAEPIAVIRLAAINVIRLGAH